MEALAPIGGRRSMPNGENMITIIGIPVLLVLVYILESKIKKIWLRTASIIVLIMALSIISFNWGVSVDSGFKTNDQSRQLYRLFENLCMLLTRQINT